VPLLSDERIETVYAAANTLAAIAGPNEVDAMDVWLRAGSQGDSGDIRKHVQKCRNRLEKRLQENKDPKKRSPKIQKCWKELQVTEWRYPGINRAVWILTAFSNESVAFLKDRLHPVSSAKQKEFEQLIADLASDSFERREAASRELTLGIVADSVLKNALANHPSLEMRRRLETILDDLPNWREKNAELLRQARAVWVLQQIGTPEAKALLEKVAAGAPSARLTQKAKDALQSLERKKGGDS
jgi:hypothetical protein